MKIYIPDLPYSSSGAQKGSLQDPFIMVSPIHYIQQYSLKGLFTGLFGL